MTESEWLNRTDSRAMLRWVKETGKASDRKLRLFAVACCRRIWPLLTDERSRKAVEVAERFADGLADEEEREATYRSAEAVHMEHRGGADAWSEAAYAAGEAASGDLKDAYADVIAAEAVAFAGNWDASRRAERDSQAALLRDIVGNPFRALPAIDPSWRTSTVKHLAHAMYEQRDFTRMPALADALAAAGFTDAEILAHCLSAQEHAKGCWVLDLVLGRA